MKIFAIYCNTFVRVFVDISIPKNIIKGTPFRMYTF